MFGEVQQAEKHFQAVTNRPEREQMLALAAFIRGDWPEVRRYLEIRDDMDGRVDPISSSAILMARVGFTARARRLLHERPPDAPPALLAMGEIALARGDNAKAVRLLEEGLEQRARAPIGAFFFGSESLAKVYVRGRRFDDALGVLQRASAE